MLSSYLVGSFSNILICQILSMDLAAHLLTANDFRKFQFGLVEPIMNIVDSAKVFA